jgi:RNA polymerase sigma factor (sigma-70 family)
MKEIVKKKDIEHIFSLLKGRFYPVNKEMIYESIYDVICSIHQNRGKFENMCETDRQRYLYKASRNRLIFYINRINMSKKKRGTVFERLYNNENNNEREILWDNRWNELMENCDRLTTDELEILEWHYFTPIMLKDIAALKNKSVSAIQKLHTRTLKKIRNMIEPS